MVSRGIDRASCVQFDRKCCTGNASHAWRRIGPGLQAGGEEEESGEEWKVDGRRARQAVDKGGAWGGAGKQNKRGKPLAIFH